MNEETPRIDPNMATAEELMTIPGVGPVLAENIISARPFETLADLLEVKGISPAFLEKMLPALSLDPQSAAAAADPDSAESEPLEAELVGEPEPPVEPDLAVAAEVEPQAEEPADADDQRIPDEPAPAVELAAASEKPAQQEDRATIDRPEQAPRSAEKPGEESREPTKPAPPKFVTRGQAFGLAASAAFFAFVLALAVTFSVLIASNGGLRYATPDQMQSLGTQVESLQTRASGLGSDIEGLRTRMDNLETLGGRVTSLEETAGTLQSDLDSVTADVEAFGLQVETLAGEIETLLADSEKYQSFINGLYQFIHDYADAEGGSGE